MPDLVDLSRYPRILAIYDLDSADDSARQTLSHFARILAVPPPAHDLSDFFRSGGDLRSWIANKFNATTFYYWEKYCLLK